METFKPLTPSQQTKVDHFNELIKGKDIATLRAKMAKDLEAAKLRPRIPVVLNARNSAFYDEILGIHARSTTESRLLKDELDTVIGDRLIQKGIGKNVKAKSSQYLHDLTGIQEDKVEESKAILQTLPEQHMPAWKALQTDLMKLDSQKLELLMSEDPKTGIGLLQDILKQTLLKLNGLRKSDKSPNQIMRKQHQAAIIVNGIRILKTASFT